MSNVQRLTKLKLKNIQRLLLKKYRKREKSFLVEGVHLVEEALQSDWQIEMLLATQSFQENTKTMNLIRTAKARKVPVYTITEKELERISDTMTSQGVIGVLKIKKENLDSLKTLLLSKSLFLAFDGVSDPGNVGTMIRTSDWFGVDAILLSEHTADIFSPKIVRATMGAIFHLPIYVDVKLPAVIEEAKRYGFKIIITTIKGGELMSIQSFTSKSLIVFGNEAHGVSEDVMKFADKYISIPRFGRAESLNVAVACGIILSCIRLA